MQAGCQFPIHELPGPSFLANENQRHGSVTEIFLPDAAHNVVVIIAVDQFFHGLVAADSPRNEYVTLVVNVLMDASTSSW